MKAVNLIPPEERGGGSGMGAGRSGGVVYVIFGLLAGLAVMAFLYGSAAHKISSDKAEVASLNARAQQAQAKAAALAPYTSFVAMREQREQAVETLINSRFDWANAFHELGRVLPANVSLASLNGQVGGSSGSSSSSSSSSKSGVSGSSSVSSATPPGSVPMFTLAGCTTSQANVALVLDRLRLMNGVSEVNLQSSTKSGPSGGGSGSGSSSGGGGAGNCGSGSVTFDLTVTFDALPTLPTSGSSSTNTIASTSSTSSSVSSATSTGVPR
jgi:hypothetical protein